MSLAQKIRVARELFAYHRSRSAAFAEHDYHDVYGATRERLERALGRPVAGMRVLDIGCGQRTPASLLFAAAGNTVAGIDTELITPGPGPISFLRVWRANGLERAAKTLVRQILFDPAYDRRLSELAGKRLSRRALDLRCLSVAALPFDDASFDVVISNAVFEHLPDVPAALAQVARVLKPGGVCHIGIHLFPSLSGGHHMAWAFPDESVPEGIPPWDHLRENRFPAHVYLNRLRESDYQAAFAAAPALELLEWVTARTEGESLLTPEIERELAESLHAGGSPQALGDRDRPPAVGGAPLFWCSRTGRLPDRSSSSMLPLNASPDQLSVRSRLRRRRPCDCLPPVLSAALPAPSVSRRLSRSWSSSLSLSRSQPGPPPTSSSRMERGIFPP